MNGAVRTLHVPRCILCGADGGELYAGLRDRLFAAPGVWSVARCTGSGCGLLWLDPMPAPEELPRLYEVYYTHATERPRGRLVDRLFLAAKRGYVANRFGYAASALERAAGLLPWIYPGRAAELDFSVMWLAAGSGRLLDVGSGSGWLVQHMQSLGWEAEGVDFDPHAVELARARGLKVRLGGLHEQRFAAESFDALTMSHSIEHVHDPVALLAEARRVLRAGGRLAVATPNAASLLHRWFGPHWFPLDPPRHLHLFNRAALGAALRAAGFTRASVFTSVRDANGAFLGSRSIRRSGRHDMTSPQGPLNQLLGRAVQLAESVRLLFDADAGEDLVALAYK